MPHIIDQPVRTAHIFVHYYNSTHYCNTGTVFIYIPLPPDQQSNITSQMWPSGGKGGYVEMNYYKEEAHIHTDSFMTTVGSMTLLIRALRSLWSPDNMTFAFLEPRLSCPYIKFETSQFLTIIPRNDHVPLSHTCILQTNKVFEVPENC